MVGMLSICAVISFYRMLMCVKCVRWVAAVAVVVVVENNWLFETEKKEEEDKHHTKQISEWYVHSNAKSIKWYNRISYSLRRPAIPIHTNIRTWTHLKCYYRINNSHEHHYFFLLCRYTHIAQAHSNARRWFFDATSIRYMFSGYFYFSSIFAHRDSFLALSNATRWLIAVWEENGILIVRRFSPHFCGRWLRIASFFLLPLLLRL